MRLRNVKGSREMIATNDFVVHEEETMKGMWHDFFENENPIHIEVGMGKGRFIIDMAKLHPEINYIGIEKYSSVLVRAIEKQTIEQLPNLVFIRMDAEAIENVFEKDEVAYIYLNFSDPWPKDRHARRRLTSVQFLNRYVNFLAADWISHRRKLLFILRHDIPLRILAMMQVKRIVDHLPTGKFYLFQ